MRETTSGSGSTSQIFDEPRPPDLGPDVVICGQVGDQAMTDDDIATLAGCEIFVGDLRFPYPDVTDLSSLGSLRMVQGRVATYEQDDGISTLSGLNNLEWIGDTLTLRTLRDVSALRNLRFIQKSLIWGPMDLASLQGLDRLHGIGDSIWIGENPTLRNIQGLSSLEWIGGCFQIWGNPNLVSLDGASRLEWIAGDVVISNNEHLRGLSGLSSLTSIGGDVRIANNPALSSATINAFLENVEIGGEVHIE